MLTGVRIMWNYFPCMLVVQNVETCYEQKLYISARSAFSLTLIILLRAYLFLNAIAVVCEFAGKQWFILDRFVLKLMKVSWP